MRAAATGEAAMGGRRFRLSCIGEVDVGFNEAKEIVSGPEAEFAFGGGTG
jgi:hypothetical protein